MFTKLKLSHKIKSLYVSQLQYVMYNFLNYFFIKNKRKIQQWNKIFRSIVDFETGAKVMAKE